jgi:methyl-CpG-binding domain protein 4
MIPPRSPFGLIQEDYWPDEFKILVVCVLLNCTTRRAVEKVTNVLFQMYPDAAAMSKADPQKLSEIIAPLGFKNRRTEKLIQLSKQYLTDSWDHAKQLPGIGDYAAAAWEIFVLGSLPVSCPNDHALTKYWHWRVRHGF